MLARETRTAIPDSHRDFLLFPGRLTAALFAYVDTSLLRVSRQFMRELEREIFCHAKLCLNAVMEGLPLSPLAFRPGARFAIPGT